MNGETMTQAWRELEKALADAVDVQCDSTRPAQERDAAAKAVYWIAELRGELRAYRGVSDRELTYQDGLAELQGEMIAVAELDDAALHKRGGLFFARPRSICAHIARTIDNQLIIDRSPALGQ